MGNQQTGDTSYDTHDGFLSVYNVREEDYRLVKKNQKVQKIASKFLLAEFFYGLIGFLFPFSFCEAIHTLFICVADVSPHMHAPLVSCQVTSQPTAIPVTPDRLA